MPRYLRAAIVLALAACAEKSGTTPNSPAAQTATQTLTIDQLAGYVSQSQGGVSEATAQYIAGAWVDVAAFTELVAKGESLTDSATAAAALWPRVADLLLSRWHDSVAAHRPEPPVVEVDAMYEQDSVRVVQEILVKVPRGADSATVRKAYLKAQQVLAKAKEKGADFAQLARKLSDDPSAATGGYLPARPRQAYPRQFVEMVWPLEAGEIAGAVTDDGFHIVRRPPLPEARPFLLARLVQERGKVADSVLGDSLLQSRSPKVSPRAAELVRTLLSSPSTVPPSDTLVGWTGGALTAEEALRWFGALPPPLAAGLRRSSNPRIEEFLMTLTRKAALVDEAVAHGARITPAEWKTLADGYAQDVALLKRSMGIDSVAGKGKAGPVVQEYFGSLMRGEVRYHPLPASLSAVVRLKTQARLSDFAVADAVELAQRRWPPTSAPARPGQPAWSRDSGRAL